MKHPYSRKKRIDYENTDFELIKDLTNQIIIKINPTPSTINEYLKYLSETNGLNWITNHFDLVMDSWENYSNQNLTISDREKIYYSLINDELLGISAFNQGKNKLGNESETQFKEIKDIQDNLPKPLLSEVKYPSKRKWFKKQLKKIKFKEFDSKEIILVSIIFGVVAFLVLGYMFGESQEIKYSYQTSHSRFNVKSLEEFKFNYVLAFAGFIIVSIIMYLFLNKRK